MKIIVSALLVGSAVALSGCYSPDGRFVPPTPLGRALFGQPAVVQEPVYGVAPQRVVVTQPMPRMRTERRVRVPARGYADPVWVPGHYDWRGSRWAWRSGRYVDRPRPGARWVQPSYNVIGAQSYYQPGYWM